MKIFSLLLALFAVAEARKFTKPTAFTRALNVRGGGELGPLDGDLAMQLSKTATSAYIAGSASKFIAGKTGGGSNQLADFVTSDLFQAHALITVIATAMYGLDATGYSDLKMLAALALGALLLRFDSSGFSLDTVKSNKVQSLIAVLLAFVAYVK